MSQRGVNQLAGTVFGATYVLVGLLGFAITRHVEFAGMEGHKLLGIFMVNPLHNIVHLAVGATLFAAARGTERAAAGVNAAVGAVYLLVGVVGLFVLDKSANILALNAADNALHFASAALLLVVGVKALSPAGAPVADQRS
jgi:threonine/homoserine/homoserine lactone efflux protein